MPTDPSTTPSTTTTVNVPAPATPDIGFAPDGTMTGVDGLLNQIAAAIAREAGPLIRDVLLPEIRRDTALQDRIGGAAGRAAVQELKPVLWTVAGILGVVATVYVVHTVRRPPPSLPPPHYPALPPPRR